METPQHRCAADRHGLRYPSDLTDAEWMLVGPMIPPARRGGRSRDVNVREVLNAICYVLETGCQWKALPKGLPPKSTAHHYFLLWDRDGTLRRIHHTLCGPMCEQASRGSRSKRPESEGGPCPSAKRGDQPERQVLCA
jgi:transposase